MKLSPLASLLLMLPLASFAKDMRSAAPEVDADIKTRITPFIIEAIKVQNMAHAGLDADAIKKLDDQWRAEVISANKPFITKVLENEVSTELRKIQAASNGRYLEIFITDNKGLNVGQTGITTDYWQGDEEKFTKVFPTIGTYSREAEFDESVQAMAGEVDGTITSGGQPIGTYTVKIKTE